MHSTPMYGDSYDSRVSSYLPRELRRSDECELSNVTEQASRKENLTVRSGASRSALQQVASSDSSARELELTGEGGRKELRVERSMREIGDPVSSDINSRRTSENSLLEGDELSGKSSRSILMETTTSRYPSEASKDDIHGVPKSIEHSTVNKPSKIGFQYEDIKSFRERQKIEGDRLQLHRGSLSGNIVETVKKENLGAIPTPDSGYSSEIAADLGKSGDGEVRHYDTGSVPKTGGNTDTSYLHSSITSADGGNRFSDRFSRERMLSEAISKTTDTGDLFHSGSNAGYKILGDRSVSDVYQSNLPGDVNIISTDASTQLHTRSSNYKTPSVTDPLIPRDERFSKADALVAKYLDFSRNKSKRGSDIEFDHKNLSSLKEIKEQKENGKRKDDKDAVEEKHQSISGKPMSYLSKDSSYEDMLKKKKEDSSHSSEPSSILDENREISSQTKFAYGNVTSEVDRRADIKDSKSANTPGNSARIDGKGDLPRRPSYDWQSSKRAREQAIGMLLDTTRRHSVDSNLDKKTRYETPYTTLDHSHFKPTPFIGKNVENNHIYAVLTKKSGKPKPDSLHPEVINQREGEGPDRTKPAYPPSYKPSSTRHKPEEVPREEIYDKLRRGSGPLVEKLKTETQSSGLDIPKHDNRRGSIEGLDESVYERPYLSSGPDSRLSKGLDSPVPMSDHFGLPLDKYDKPVPLHGKTKEPVNREDMIHGREIVSKYPERPQRPRGSDLSDFTAYEHINVTETTRDSIMQRSFVSRSGEVIEDEFRRHDEIGHGGQNAIEGIEGTHIRPEVPTRVQRYRAAREELVKDGLKTDSDSSRIEDVKQLRDSKESTTDVTDQHLDMGNMQWWNANTTEGLQQILGVRGSSKETSTILATYDEGTKPTAWTWVQTSQKVPEIRVEKNHTLTRSSRDIYVDESDNGNVELLIRVQDEEAQDHRYVAIRQGPVEKAIIVHQTVESDLPYTRKLREEGKQGGGLQVKNGVVQVNMKDLTPEAREAWVQIMGIKDRNFKEYQTFEIPVKFDNKPRRVKSKEDIYAVPIKKNKRKPLSTPSVKIDEVGGKKQLDEKKSGGFDKKKKETDIEKKRRESKLKKLDSEKKKKEEMEKKKKREEMEQKKKREEMELKKKREEMEQKKKRKEMEKKKKQEEMEKKKKREEMEQKKKREEMEKKKKQEEMEKKTKREEMEKKKKQEEMEQKKKEEKLKWEKERENEKRKEIEIERKETEQQKKYEEVSVVKGEMPPPVNRSTKPTPKVFKEIYAQEIKRHPDVVDAGMFQGDSFTPKKTGPFVMTGKTVTPRAQSARVGMTSNTQGQNSTTVIEKRGSNQTRQASPSVKAVKRISVTQCGKTRPYYADQTNAIKHKSGSLQRGSGSSIAVPLRGGASKQTNGNVQVISNQTVQNPQKPPEQNIRQTTVQKSHSYRTETHISGDDALSSHIATGQVGPGDSFGIQHVGAGHIGVEGVGGRREHVGAGNIDLDPGLIGHRGAENVGLQHLGAGHVGVEHVGERHLDSNHVEMHHVSGGHVGGQSVSGGHVGYGCVGVEHVGGGQAVAEYVEVHNVRGGHVGVQADREGHVGPQHVGVQHVGGGQGQIGVRHLRSVVLHNMPTDSSTDFSHESGLQQLPDGSYVQRDVAHVRRPSWGVEQGPLKGQSKC